MRSENPEKQDDAGFMTNYQAEIKRREADYYALQAQIKPHFLYNTLENIRMMVELNGDTTTGEMVYALERFIKYNMVKDKKFAFIPEEIENVKNYLQIHKIRWGKGLDYTIALNADADHYKCPRYILQPIVENCFIHGFRSIRRRKSIAITLDENDKFFEIAIMDNGCGIDPERLKSIQAALDNAGSNEELATEGEGIGLFNVNMRLKMFYGAECGIKISNLPGGGTKCLLRLGKLKDNVVNINI